MKDSAPERVRRRVRELLDRPKRSQRKLAAALAIDHGELSRKLSNDPDVQHDFTLRQLDGVAAYLEVPPAALLQDEASRLWELERDETLIIRLWREWPADIQQFALGLLSYFAGLSPMEKELRRFYSKYRRLRKADRDYIDQTIEELLRLDKLAKSDARRSREAESAPATSPSASAASPGARRKKSAG